MEKVKIISRTFYYVIDERFIGVFTEEARLAMWKVTNRWQKND
jgi:hypothetical protein